MEEAEQRTDEQHDEQRRPEVDPEPHRHPPGHGAGGEDALDAEIEDAGPLADQRAEDAEDQRRADPDRRRPEIRREQDVEEVHAAMVRASGGAGTPLPLGEDSETLLREAERSRAW